MKSKQFNFNKVSYLLLLFVFTFGNLYAQQTITGNITDETSPLPGVTVVEKGTSNGTTSDFDGNFTISVADENSILVFSYLGFITQEVSASSDSFNISMVSGADELQEVVVTGYGTQRKATLTGSVASIGGEALEKSSSPNLGSSDCNW